MRDHVKGEASTSFGTLAFPPANVCNCHWPCWLSQHCSDVTWASWRLKLLVALLFVQHLVQDNKKENVKAPSHYKPFMRGIHRSPMDSPHKWSVMGKAVLCSGVIMGSVPHIPWESMMTSSNGNIFRVTDHLCGEFTGPRWIPRTKASEAELWCFLWSASE